MREIGKSIARLAMIVKKTTKDYLEESAIQLFSKYSVEKVSIIDICKNCSVSIRTYYNYFKDKYDIINQCYISRFKNYIETNRKNINLRKLMLYLAREVCNNPEFFRNVFRYTGQNNIRTGVSNPLSDIFIKTLEYQSHKDLENDEKMAVRFYIDGILSYVENQLKQSILPTPEESAKYCQNAIPAKLEKYL